MSHYSLIFAFGFSLIGLSTIMWIATYPQMAELSLNESLTALPRFLAADDTAFNHNFCESRLQNNTGPELWNAWTSLIISVVPFVFGFPSYPLFYNVACMLALNGVSSFHYHYCLTWLGKQGDEISMILANYFGLWGLINMYYKRCDRRNQYNRYNTAFMYAFLVANTLIEYDPLFPSIFGIYVGGTLAMIYRVGAMYRVPYRHNLLVSFVGASCWIVSEHFCNEYTMFGHPLWHLLFPLGFYRLILDYDKAKQVLPAKTEDLVVDCV